jgi:signal recognition particle subunit SRP54
MPGMPGMPGLGGGGGLPGMSGPGRNAKGKGKKRTGGRSGNPAKRAEQERAATQRTEQGLDKAMGSAFGSGAATTGPEAREDVDPSSVSLPPGFEKFLGT